VFLRTDDACVPLLPKSQDEEQERSYAADHRAPSYARDYPDDYWGKVHTVPCALVQELERVTRLARRQGSVYPRAAIDGVARVLSVCQTMGNSAP